MVVSKLSSLEVGLDGACDADLDYVLPMVVSKLSWLFLGGAESIGLVQILMAFAFGGLGMPWGASDSYDAMVGHVSGRPSGG